MNKDIKNQLTPEQIHQFVVALGVPTESIIMTSFGFIMPTYCHNTLDTEAKQKLYYYNNSKLFKCYTECDSSFDIFELYKKLQLNFHSKEVNLYEAIHFVASFFGISDMEMDYISISDFDYLNKFLPKQNFITNLKTINSHILDIFSDFEATEWKNEGINHGTFKTFGIKYQMFDERIIIPHKDVHGNLVGIRVRNLRDSDINFRGKYCPLYYNNTLYNHPLSLNLYGLYENLDNIQNTGTAIIFEGEKSVLKLHSYLPQQSIGVAVCGSHISEPQIQLLTRHGKVNTVVIAFDKEYTTPEEYDKYYYKIRKIADKIKPYATTYVMMDSTNLLNHKDSPIDGGLDTFLKLYSQKIQL